MRSHKGVPNPMEFVAQHRGRLEDCGSPSWKPPRPLSSPSGSHGGLTTGHGRLNHWPLVSPWKSEWDREP